MVSYDRRRRRKGTPFAGSSAPNQCKAGAFLT
jgi:hypothetical protein